VSGPIIGVAHDPGGARAIFPVLELLGARGFQVFAVVSGPATAIIDAEYASLGRLHMEDSSAVASCVRLLKQKQCAILLSAAGLYNRIEHTMRRAARQLGIPVVAVLDWWSAYRERFERMNPDGSTERSWPDQFCAIDSVSRDGLIEAGFPPEKITITGSVSLESSAQRLEQYTGERQQIRSELGVGESALCAIFFSEPYIKDSDGLPWGGVGGYFKDDGTPVFGYTSHEMLLEVASVLAKQFRAGKNLVLCVKPHPMEHIPSLEATLRECAKAGLPVRIVENDDPAKLLAAGDIFFGMASIILLEAVMTGKPVISVQIGLSAERMADPCVANRLGFSTPIGNRASLEDAVARWLAGKDTGATAANPTMWDGAAERVAESILDAIEAGFPGKPAGKTNQ
jgi:hypothetical protein